MCSTTFFSTGYMLSSVSHVYVYWLIDWSVLIDVPQEMYARAIDLTPNAFSSVLYPTKLCLHPVQTANVQRWSVRWRWCDDRLTCSSVNSIIFPEKSQSSRRTRPLPRSCFSVLFMGKQILFSRNAIDFWVCASLTSPIGWFYRFSPHDFPYNRLLSVNILTYNLFVELL